MLSTDLATGVLSLSLKTESIVAFPLRTVSQTEAVLQGSGRNLGTLVRVTEHNGVETLSVFGVSFARKSKRLKKAGPLEIREAHECELFRQRLAPLAPRTRGDGFHWEGGGPDPRATSSLFPSAITNQP